MIHDLMYKYEIQSVKALITEVLNRHLHTLPREGGLERGRGRSQGAGIRVVVADGEGLIEKSIRHLRTCNR